MLRIFTTSAFVVGLMLFTTTGYVNATPFLLSDTDDVKDIISHFRSEMSALIAQAGSETRVTLVRAFQLSDSLINAMTVAYGDSVKLTFAQLNEQQKKAFSDTAHLLDQIDEAVKDPLKDFSQNWTVSNSIVADVASWTKRPIVTAYGPGFVSPSGLADAIRVSVGGVRLHGAGVDSPKLTIGKVEYKPDDYTDVSLGFTVPRSAFATRQKGTSFQSATLTFYHDAGGFNPFRKPEEIPFRLLFTVLPEELGSFSTSIVVAKGRPDVVHLRTPDITASKEGGGGDTQGDCYTPKKDYTFDLLTPHLVETVHLGRKDDDHSPGTNDGKMSYKDGVKTERLICIQVNAHTGCTECGATSIGHLEVDMVRTVYDDITTETPVKSLNWNEDAVIRLQDNAKSSLITIKLFDSITYVETATNAKSLQFLKIDPDLQNNVLILRPKRDWVAK